MGRRDEAAYADFVAATQDRLRRTAYLLTGDRAAAEDVVQEALVRVYVAWPRLARQGSPVGYARRAVVSVAVDQHRRRSTRRRYETRVPPAPSHVDDSTGTTDREVLVAALRALPPRQRACVVLRYLEDLDVATTAGVLGISAGTVKSQTSHALTALRRHLAAAGHHDLATWEDPT